MQHMGYRIAILLASISITTIITVAVSVISRRYNISYTYFSLLSIVLYVTTAYLLYEKSGDKLQTITVLLLLGFYDGTVCWQIAKKLRANHGKYHDLAKEITPHQAILASLIYAFAMAWIGIFLAG